MVSPARRFVLAAGLTIVGASVAGVARRAGSLTDEQRAKRGDTETSCNRSLSNAR
jgi:hypothetical protein